jgi:hypothetical protein
LNIGPPEDFARYFCVKFAYEIFVRTVSDRMYEISSSFDISKFEEKIYNFFFDLMHRIDQRLP